MGAGLRRLIATPTNKMGGKAESQSQCSARRIMERVCCEVWDAVSENSGWEGEGESFGEFCIVLRIERDAAMPQKQRQNDSLTIKESSKVSVV